MTKFLIAVFFILFASSASADSKVYGHMAPLSSELLPYPMALKCGAVVKEWRGSLASYKSRMQTANNLCSFTKKHFFEFIHSKGYESKNAPFRYSIAMLPVDSKYRSLNDKEYRFVNRAGVQGEISGYTSHTSRYVFNVGDIDDYEFDVSFVHELFHAMSHHYGVLDQHQGSGRPEKTTKDEQLAQEFTVKYLGLK